MANTLELLTRIEVEGARELDSASQKMGAMGGKLTKGVTLPLLAGGAALTKLAGDAQVVDAKLSSTFESMGAHTWTSVEALEAAADELDAMSSGFDRNAILEAQAVMLTFGNVTGEVFGDANNLVIDMAESLGTDLQGASIQVGKALNDPVKGVSALADVGVSFTEQQREMIAAMVEAGDTAGAQGIIMGELENQFGGTAQAIADTDFGQAQEAMQQLKTVGAELGSVLLPILGTFAGWLRSITDRFKELSPETQETIVKVLAVAAAIGPLLIVGAKLVTAFGAISKAFTALKLLMLTNPFLLLIAAVIALVALIVANWDTISQTIRDAWEWIKARTSEFGDWLRSFFEGIPEAIGRAMSTLGEAITSPFRAAFNGIADLWNRTLGSLSFTVPDWIPGVGGNSFSLPKIPRLASGGIVTAPTLALIGEAGPEAVVPLGAGGMGATYIEINLPSGAFLDPVDAGRQIVEAIRSYERSSGGAWRLSEV